MGLYTPKKVILNWFRYDISFTIELMSSYIQGIEEQAVESVERFRNNVESHIVEEYPGDGYSTNADIYKGYSRVVDIYKGLDSETWDLEGIFIDHFPSLQRRSALLSLIGIIEHELDKLCRLYQSEKGLKLGLSDLNGKGIERSINYLEKVAEIDVHRQSKAWNHLKKIQKIRNLIVHQDGKLIDINGNEVKAAIDYINQMDSLYGEKEIGIDEGFLSHVVSVFKDYFSLLASSIENAEQA